METSIQVMMMYCDMHPIEIHAKNTGNIERVGNCLEGVGQEACWDPDGPSRDRQCRHGEGHRGMREVHVFRKQQSFHI